MQVLGSVRNRHYDNGVAYLDHGEYELAVAELRRVVGGGTGVSAGEVKLARFHLGQAHFLLAETYTQCSQWAHAEEHLRAALEINPHYPDLHYHLARVQYATDRVDDAKESVRKALRINPEYARAILLDGLISYRRGEWEEGAAQIARAAEVEPGFRTPAMEAAIALHTEGRNSEALLAFARVADMSVDEISELIRTAREKLRLGAISEAASCARDAVKMSPDYPDVRNLMGLVHLAREEYLQAVNEFKAALHLNPAFVAASINLGRACRAMGNEDAAQSAFRQALALDPENEEARELLSAA